MNFTDQIFLTNQIFLTSHLPPWRFANQFVFVTEQGEGWLSGVADATSKKHLIGEKCLTIAERKVRGGSLVWLMGLVRNV